MNRVLLLEPDTGRCASMVEFLSQRKIWAVAAHTLVEADRLLEKQVFHLAIASVEGDSQMEILSRWKTLHPSMPLVATSSNSAPSFIVAAVRAGASHFWHFDSELERLGEVVQETLSRSVVQPVAEPPIDFPLPHFIGRHPRILEIFQLILSLKGTDSTVLITGESGTGKEVVARAIHDLSSRKRQGLVAVNCGAIPAPLLESELFGHVKGAFTGASHNRIGRFQAAGAGTLFLDEISDLPIDLQGKLLRAIQQRVFEPVGSTHSVTLEARIIAATNQDLETLVAEKRFREDLYYRLNVIPIVIPPLRARRSDIPLLVRSFLENFCKANHKKFCGISEEAMQSLTQYHWPGNVRELENLMERVVVLKRGNDVIDLKDLPVQHFRRVRVDRFVANVALPEEGLDFNEAVGQFENELILQALHRTHGNKNKAATLLNLNRTTLVEKLKRKGLRLTS